MASGSSRRIDYMSLKKQQEEEAELRAKETNAVRRKQGKLTREVCVEDIITVIESDLVPLPLKLRAELLRFFNMALDSVPLSTSSTTTTVPTLTESVLLSWKSLTTNQYCSRTHVPYPPGSARLPVTDDRTGASRQRKRFPDVWVNQICRAAAAVATSQGAQRKGVKSSSAAATNTAEDNFRSAEDRPSNSRLKRKRPGGSRRLGHSNNSRDLFDDADPLLVSARRFSGVEPPPSAAAIDTKPSPLRYPPTMYAGDNPLFSSFLRPTSPFSPLPTQQPYCHYPGGRTAATPNLHTAASSFPFHPTLGADLPVLRNFRPHSSQLSALYTPPLLSTPQHHIAQNPAPYTPSLMSTI